MAKSTQAKLLFFHSVTEEESQVRERLQAGAHCWGAIWIYSFSKRFS
jgi:hypothetical protein